MTDQKRDESRDVQIACRNHVPCDDYAGHWFSLKVTPKMLPLDIGDTLDRFVPHSDLVAAESVAKRAVKLLNMIDRGHPDVADFIGSLPAEYFE